MGLFENWCRDILPKLAGKKIVITDQDGKKSDHPIAGLDAKGLQSLARAALKGAKTGKGLATKISVE